MACSLLFAKDPRIKFPGCYVRFLRFDGETEGTGEKFNAVKDIDVHGNLLRLIQGTEKFSTSNSETSRGLAKMENFSQPPNTRGQHGMRLL